MFTFSIQMNCYKHFSIKNWATKRSITADTSAQSADTVHRHHRTHQTLVDELRAAEFVHSRHSTYFPNNIATLFIFQITKKQKRIKVCLGFNPYEKS